MHVTEDRGINIAGLDKAAVLAALYNGTRAVGMGVLHDLQQDMTVDEARLHLAQLERLKALGVIVIGGGPLRFDYVAGRPIKVDLSKDTFDPYLYDRDAGQGRAADVIAALRHPEDPTHGR